MSTARERALAHQQAVVAGAVEHSGPDLLSYFERRVTARGDAADLLSEVFVIAWRRADAVPSDEQEARMWLFGVARNVLANHRRGVRRSTELGQRLRLEIDRVSRLDAGAESTAVLVREAVDQLPDPLDELVRLVHWDGFGIGQAGQLLGMTASTARTRYARARHLLTVRLQLASPSAMAHTRPSIKAAE